MIVGILTVMPVFEADLLTANPSSTDDDSNHEKDRDTYHFHSNKSSQDADFANPSTRQSVQDGLGAGAYSDSQNSISPYANIPTMLSPRNTNQKIKIHAHCGTTSVQYIITNETELYSFASTVTHKYCVMPGQQRLVQILRLIQRKWFSVQEFCLKVSPSLTIPVFVWKEVLEKMRLSYPIGPPQAER